jgi:hypothetical protein
MFCTKLRSPSPRALRGCSGLLRLCFLPLSSMGWVGRGLSLSRVLQFHVFTALAVASSEQNASERPQGQSMPVLFCRLPARKGMSFCNCIVFTACPCVHLLTACIGNHPVNLVRSEQGVQVWLRIVIVQGVRETNPLEVEGRYRCNFVLEFFM